MEIVIDTPELLEIKVKSVKYKLSMICILLLVVTIWCFMLSQVNLTVVVCYVIATLLVLLLFPTRRTFTFNTIQKSLMIQSVFFMRKSKLVTYPYDQIEGIYFADYTPNGIMRIQITTKSGKKLQTISPSFMSFSEVIKNAYNMASHLNLPLLYQISYLWSENSVGQIQDENMLNQVINSRSKWPAS